MSRRTRKSIVPILMTTGVLGGGGGFSSQINPASGTLYTAPADGTYTLYLTQPTTNPYTRIELRYRVQDASNYWTIYIERNYTNTAWDLKRSVVQAGTPTATTLQTNIGTVQALRVTLSGTSHSWFSSADGENFTARSSTTSAVFETANQIGASYTGASGSELYTTANAASITNEANATTGVTGNTTPTVEGIDIHNGSYAIRTQGTSTGSFQNVVVSLSAFNGTEIVVQCYVKGVVGETSQRVRFATFSPADSTFLNVTSAYSLFSHRGTPSADGVYCYVTYGVSNSTNVQLADAVSVKAVAALDDAGTTGPTLLEAS